MECKGGLVELCFLGDLRVLLHKMEDVCFCCPVFHAVMYRVWNSRANTVLPDITAGFHLLMTFSYLLIMEKGD